MSNLFLGDNIPIKHIQTKSHMEGDFWFDGSSWPERDFDIKVNKILGEHRDSRASLEFAEEVRKYLADLALKRKGLGAIHLFEIDARGKFIAFANFARTELNKIMTDDFRVETRARIFELRQIAKSRDASHADPNLTVIMTPEWGLPLYPDMDVPESSMDHLRHGLRNVGSGYPRIDDISAILENQD